MEIRDLEIEQKQKEIIYINVARCNFNYGKKEYIDRYNSRMDFEENADLLLFEYTTLKFALRNRQSKFKAYKDITFRYRTKNGNYNTEFKKIIEGHGDYCLYTWCDKGQEPEAYVLVDLHELRNNIENLKFEERTNKDSSIFKTVSVEELRMHNCVIASKGL